VVQLGHHSYNPSKDCDPQLLAPHLAALGATSCGPNTWHWSDVQLAPAKPFTLLRPDHRTVEAGSAATPLVFASPAPADARLQFTAVGERVEVSTDGGTTWQPAQKQATGAQDVRGGDHFVSYWTPVPKGSTTVMVRAQDWWGGPWLARDLSIWATSSPSATAAGAPLAGVA
jgi:hypothetical protein